MRIEALFLKTRHEQNRVSWCAMSKGYLLGPLAPLAPVQAEGRQATQEGHNTSSSTSARYNTTQSMRGVRLLRVIILLYLRQSKIIHQNTVRGRAWSISVKQPKWTKITFYVWRTSFEWLNAKQLGNPLKGKWLTVRWARQNKFLTDSKTECGSAHGL